MRRPRRGGTNAEKRNDRDRQDLPPRPGYRSPRWCPGGGTGFGANPHHRGMAGFRTVASLQVFATHGSPGAATGLLRIASGGGAGHGPPGATRRTSPTPDSGSRRPATRTAATLLATVREVTWCRAAICTNAPAGWPSRAVVVQHGPGPG